MSTSRAPAGGRIVSSGVELVPMSAAELDRLLEHLLPGYAREHVLAGRWSADEAPAAAREEVRRLLPKGVESPGHLFYLVHDPRGKAVASLWLYVEKKFGFVYYVEVKRAQRGKGWGRASMRAAEEAVRRAGATSLGLHVFARNTVAVHLYESLGYESTDLVMRKSLPRARGRSRGRRPTS